MDSALFSRLVRDYLHPAVPGATLSHLLAAVADQEIRVQMLAPLLHENQVYEQYLLRVDILRDRIAQWAAEEEGNPEQERVLVQRTLGLLGKAATRNVVASIRMNRATGTGLPRREAEKFVISPQTQLNYALIAESFCEDRGLAYPSQAFLAGLHYDWLSAMMSVKKIPRDAKTYLDSVWKDAFRTARIAYGLGSTLSAFKYHKYVFGSGLLMPLGKVLMAVLFPRELGARSWLGFVGECDKNKETRDFTVHVREKNQFPVTHNELSSLLACFFTFFRPVEQAIYYYRDPNYLKNADYDLYLLSSILSLSALYTSGTPPVESLSLIHKNCLIDLQIEEEDFIPLIEKSLKEGG